MWLPDLRFAARTLGKNPLFTASVIGLLALGIAANTVMFSVVDALLLRPLPVRDPERLVRIVTIRPTLGPRSEFAFDDEFQAWQKQVTGFESLLAWSERDAFVTAGESTERVRAHFVTDNFFTALGVKPALGRLLSTADGTPDGDTPPVVLSHHYWLRRFSGDPSVVGRTAIIDGHKAVVVGVTPKGFNGLAVETGPDIRMPIGWVRTLRLALLDNRIVCGVAGRLRAGVSPEAVRQQAEAVWRHFWHERHKANPADPGQFALEPAARGVSRMREEFGSVLWLLMGGVGLLALMISANVAGLMLARSAARRGELAVRSAIGATRPQLIRQLSCEGLLLMAGGAVGAIAVSMAVLPFVVGMLPPVRDFTAARMALTLDISLDWRVLGFSLAASAFAVLLFGFAPALMVARRDLHLSLKEARAGSGWRGRQALVVLQVALCTMLLVGAGLTTRTLQRLERVDAGLDRERVVTFTIDPDMAKYKPEELAKFRRRLLDGARALPDVSAAAIGRFGLMRGTGLKATVAWAGERARPEDFMVSSGNAVSPEYFETMRIPWIEGRNFTGLEDVGKAPMPVVVNRAFVRWFGAGQPVIGRAFGYTSLSGNPAKPAYEVIGVVGDARYRSLREPFHPIVYSLPLPGQTFLVHIRTRAAPGAAIAPMRRLLADLDPRLSYIEVTTLAADVESSVWAERVAALLAKVFSAAAAMIAAGGLYALLAFAVTQRRREIAIRLALGALPADVMRLVFSRAALLALAGIAVGLAAAWAIGPRLASILYEVEPHDAGALASAAGFVLAVAAIAAWIPSLRASRIHPASALRQE